MSPPPLHHFTGESRGGEGLFLCGAAAGGAPAAPPLRVPLCPWAPRSLGPRRVGGREIPRLADIGREVVKLRGREIAQHRRVGRKRPSCVFTSFQSPLRIAIIPPSRQYSASCGGSLILAGEKRQQVDAVERRLASGSGMPAAASAVGSTSSWMIGRDRSFLPERDLPANDEGHADAAFPRLALRSSERSIARSVDRGPGHRRSAVVAEEDDQRVLLEPLVTERRHRPADASSIADNMAA